MSDAQKQQPERYVPLSAVEREVRENISLNAGCETCSSGSCSDCTNKAIEEIMNPIRALATEAPTTPPASQPCQSCAEWVRLVEDWMKRLKLPIIAPRTIAAEMTAALDRLGKAAPQPGKAKGGA